MKIPDPEIRRARIEIIPMIDTIFFLLVFFMFSTLSMVKMKGLDVPLPRPSPAPPGPAAHEIVVSVSPRGQYAVGRQPVAPEALRSALASRIAAAPGAFVVVHVADTQPTQALITVLDALGPLTGPDGKPVPVLVGTERVTPPGQGAAHGSS